jgi:hypothetical protein
MKNYITAFALMVAVLGGAISLSAATTSATACCKSGDSPYDSQGRICACR